MKVSREAVRVKQVEDKKEGKSTINFTTILLQSLLQ